MLLVIDIDNNTMYARGFAQDLICIAHTAGVFNPVVFGQKAVI